MYFPSTLSFVNVFTIVLILVFASILLAISLVHMIIFTANTTSTITTATTATVNGVRIQAGGGNANAPWTIFLPQEIEINTGESITWYNPTEVAEPHTVTFVLDNNTMTGVVSPLDVLNKAEFIPLPAGSNNEPILIPGKSGSGMNTLIALNARSFNPVVIDAQGNVKHMSPNASYDMTGTEKYVNSGWFLPNGLEQQYPGSGNTFTVTFEKPGTYDYLCILHPWMTGSVTVR